MSDRIQVDGEALSALMDGELSEFELRRLLARIADEPELLAKWERYNLGRAVFQPEPLGLRLSASSDNLGLASKIMAAIDAEPAFDTASDSVQHNTQQDSRQNAKKSAGSIWTSQIARLAVAASVALAVFAGMQGVLTSPGSSSATSPSLASERAEPLEPLAGQNSNVQLAVDADAQQRLNEYIRSVSIPSRAEPQDAPYNILLESPMLHPVSDLELVEQVERSNP